MDNAKYNIDLGVSTLQTACHTASYAAGWWQDLSTGTDFREEARKGTRLGKALVAEKLVLIHSEISEALEGYRKGLMDDKLPTDPPLRLSWQTPSSVSWTWPVP